ncbi:MAG: putative branched-chain amino acid transport ATP-binding protein LivG [Methanocella sp. PtaU1.Bin125]|nr:MAG: putative branched-chain amino acid transport ATP-binding protein LivG [Methanocella sp. PtaU1.Bin125]
MAIVEGTDLVKDYDGLRAVDHVSFAIDRTECFGFLGPNGAGKTTVMKMIYCRTPVTHGDVRVGGISVRMEPRQVKDMIGVATQDDTLDRDLTVFENLMVYSRYFDTPRAVARQRIGDLLARFDLTGKRDTNVDDLSGGMRRKLIVARALINDPSILILDEPTTGLDPQARRQIWDMVIRLKTEGKTIILTTHYMDEAQELCDRIAVMFSGRILECGTPEDMISRVVGAHVCEIYARDETAVREIRKNISGNMEQVGNRLYVYGDNPEELAMKCDHVRSEYRVVRRTSLEDVFLKLTGGKEIK